jgi:hypothetical protein
LASTQARAGFAIGPAANYGVLIEPGAFNHASTIVVDLKWALWDHLDSASGAQCRRPQTFKVWTREEVQAVYILDKAAANGAPAANGLAH